MNGHDVDDGRRKQKPRDVASVIPKHRQELLKWNGWGYNDSAFVLKDNVIHFSGKRYPIGEFSLPFFTAWVQEVFGITLDSAVRRTPQSLLKATEYPDPVLDPDLVSELRRLDVPFSMDVVDRLVRSHGHTLHDIFVLREGKFERIPDLVAWPGSHEAVVELVALAQRRNVVVIPYGGGTSVSGALTCPAHETRTILSLDTSQMNRILWVDPDNLVACCEAGIVGQDLDRELRELGFVTGHEPDSYEFSSLGGWVATRASGMKKNVYGNIEDLLVHVRMVTPCGVLERNGKVPRVSCGPDFHHLVLGSEGTLGVITEVTIKIRPIPQCKKYGSVLFPDFESGVACLREVARQRCQPASIRLMDNTQFRFGQSLRPEPGFLGQIADGLKRIYVTRVKAFSVDTMCVATLLFEGNERDVLLQEKRIYEIAARFGGMAAGEANGERGYTLTFVIAYIRDLGLEYNVVAESFETSVPWDRTVTLCDNVKHRVEQECKGRGIKHYLITCRVTQTYDAGSCVYFYFAFNYSGLSDPLRVYEELEDLARAEILASGGSISHHHGVGKLRAKWYPAQVSGPGVQLYRAAKRELDPGNVFAVGNLLPDSKL